jgi:membrane peptidoglycan carboxypeptidase
VSKLTWNRRRATAAALVVVIGAGAALAAHVVGLDDLPDVSAVMSTGQPSDNLVYDRTGTVLLAELQQQGGQHVDVPLQAMGRWLPAATVAVDDPGFWAEPGVDPGGVAAAAWADVRAGGLVQTGTTITQRLVRLRLGAPHDNNALRLRRAALAARVGAAYSREKILEAYLNSLPYGNRATGAEAAAITYFQVDASQLDLAQAALLAGLPASPSLLDPLRNLPGARQRQREVLDAMVRSGAITRRQADQAAAETLVLVGPSTLDVVPGFTALVAAELDRRLGATAARGGLSVLTTLDWGLQQQAQRDLRDALDANRWRGAANGTLVAMDPRTGGVLALVGAADPRGPGGNSNLALVPANAGTAMGVFGYAAAIASRRYTMTTQVQDATNLETSLAGGSSYRVVNYDRRSHGACELRVCLASELNVPAIEVEMGVGVPEVLRTARALGAPPAVPGGAAQATTAPPDQYGPSLVLGGYPVTPLALTSAYAALAVGGVVRDAEAIQRVSAAGRGVLFQARPGAGRPGVDPGTAFVTSQMLADDANRAAVYGLRSPLTLPGRRAAAAVGTAENFHDGWTVGYTPSLAASVWLGALSTGGIGGMAAGSDGVFVAAPAWHRFMQGALDQLGRDDEWYSPPAGVQEATVNGRAAWFLPGTSATTPAPPVPAGVQLTGT